MFTFEGKSWTFPRGKVDEGESSYECALRETLEETGFDAQHCCREEDVLVIVNESKIIRLYVATNVSETYPFEPQTRKEISKVEFHDIDDLPKSHYGVLPFIQKLKRWIFQHSRSATMNRGGRQGGSGSGSGSGNNKTPQRIRDSSRIQARKDTSQKQQAPNTPSRTTSTTTTTAGASQKPHILTAQKNFDIRNSETFFEDGKGTKRWKVDDMFKANSKLTGLAYTYNGNPHEFGSYHPRFVNYRARGDSTTSDGEVDASHRHQQHPLSGTTADTTTTTGNKGVNNMSVIEAKRSKLGLFPSPFVLDVQSIMAAVDDALAASS